MKKSLTDGELRRAADYWSALADVTARPKSWGNFTVIKNHITKRICGRSMPSVSEALIELAEQTYGTGRFERAVSVGSGLCNKEMRLAQIGRVSRWDCFEISESRLAAAADRARSLGVSNQMNFRAEDAFEADCPGYDLVFWSNSLHHMPNVRDALRWSLERLRPGGVIAIDEFTGPNRFQWSDDVLRIGTELRARLSATHLQAPNGKTYPVQLRRPDPAKIAHHDPTESIDSASIIPAIRELLLPKAKVVDVGGIIFHVGLSGIISNFADDEPLWPQLLSADAALANEGRSVLTAAVYQFPSRS